MTRTREDGPNTVDRETMFRYQVVSLVLSREAIGDMRVQAVACAVRAVYTDLQGEQRQVSQRSVYRWLKAYREEGLEGLKPKNRARVESSVVLNEALLSYLASQKRQDPAASIPELLKRAKHQGLIGKGQAVDRSTVWRAMKRMGVNTRRCRVPKKNQCRRFAYAHRLDMVLCDGKHFRAGVKRSKRVALFFIDDATRMLLACIVGCSESASLFLRGLAKCVTNYGLMRAFYLDRGSGFIAGDSQRVLANLGVHLIFGRARYPQGHGKIEKFHQRAWDAILRRFSGNQEIDADEAHLTLRLDHYTRQIYNHEPHESLNGETPWSRFEADPIPLRFPDNRSVLKEAFTITHGRLVSKDHVVSIKGIDYEMPLGYADSRVFLWRNVLDGSLHFDHKGSLIKLEEVDLLANARRGPSPKPAQEEEEIANLPTSAEMAFNRDFGPLVDKHGNNFLKEERHERDE